MNSDDFAKTEAIIGAAFRVHNSLGGGFLESIYVKSLAIELARQSIPHQREVGINVYYEGQTVGEYRADLIAFEEIIVEIKAAQAIVPAHEAQLLNYLRATGLKVGLLINFGGRVTVKRRVL